jgi:hypothetical protein
MTGCRPISEESCSREPVIRSAASTVMVTTQTTTRGPNRLRRQGPRRASSEMTAAKTETEAVTLTMGTEKRHHGRRLARKVETGIVDATIAT